MSLGACSTPDKVASPRTVATSKSSTLEFSRTVYDARQEKVLSKKDETLVFAGPLFRNAGTPVELVEMSSALLVTGSRELHDPFFYAAASVGADQLNFMGGGCADPSGAWASCATIATVTKKKETTVAGSQDLGLDFHEYELDGASGFWAIKYVNVSCAAAGSPNCGNDAQGQPVASIGDCNIVHVVDGVIESSWSAYDHLPDGETTSARYGEYSDVFHCNSIETLTVGGEAKLLLSLRNTDSVYLLDVKSGEIDWKLGGNAWPGVSLDVENPGTLGLSSSDFEPGQLLSGQHDARYWGNGLYSVFDNGSKTERPARGIVFTVDSESKTAVIQRVFNDPDGNPSGCTGSFRQLAGGDYWVAGWGCSASGVTVFADDTSPIVSTKLNQTSPSSVDKTNSTFGPLRWTLSYRVIVE